MYKGPLTRREQVVQAIDQRIRRGDLKAGDRLPGEVRLAQEFEVSRGTIRQALAELQRQDLIATTAGLGSFITFDGSRLDPTAGWASTLADAATPVTTELLSIDPVTRDAVPDLPADVDLVDGIAIRRVRTLPDGTVVTFECSTVPSVGALADLPVKGLVDNSLATTLRTAGLVAVAGTQTVRVTSLDERHARLMRRTSGTPFLYTTRTALDSHGQLVEHVVSYLDPEHFQLQLRFGDVT